MAAWPGDCGLDLWAPPRGDEHGIQFKRVKTTADLLAETIAMDTGKALQRSMMYASRHRSLAGMNPGALDDNLETHLVGNPLSSPSEEVNPLDVANQNRRITLMGPGGISSSDMVTADMQAVHPSTFGFISPIEGPESENAGIDTRITNGVKIGSNGRLYQRFLNPRTGDFHWLSPEDLHGKTVGLPRPA